MLSKLQKLREEREQGFTLIELLVVILIIGILAAIAIPAFLNQRKSAVDSSVQSDVSNAAKAIETAAVKAGAGTLTLGTVTTDKTAGTASIAVTGANTTPIVVQISEGTTLSTSGTTRDGYIIQGVNDGGDVAKGVTAAVPTTASPGFIYSSANGGLK